MNWEAFWYYVIWSAVGSYFSLGIAITIGGFFDVIKMFRRLETEHAEAGRAGNRLEAFDVPERE